MKIAEIISIVEAFAPLSLQEPWDNSGLQLGDPSAEATGAVLTLDVTHETIDLAVERGANLVISHHPLFMDPIRSLTPATKQGTTVLRAAAHGIAIYSSHTATDSAPEGINQWMADSLDLHNVKSLTPLGLGRVGDLPKPLPVPQFAALLKNIFSLPTIRTNTSPTSLVARVALCGGSGTSLIPEATALGADTLITGDVKYHTFDNPLQIFDIGHFESENQFISLISTKISEIFPIFALHKQNSNFITYL